MTRWFRHYAGLCRDDKLVRVALKSKQPVERVVWVWAAILESASEINDNGRYDFDAGEASYFLRADEADVDSICRAMEDLERVRQGVVVKWDARQFQSDSSAERVARYRDKRQGNGLPRSSNLSDFYNPVAARDGRKCVYCFSKEKLCLDHMVPVVQGGIDDLDNLAFACKACNSGKSGRTPLQAGYTIKVKTAADALSRFQAKCNGYSNAPELETETELETEVEKKEPRESAIAVERDADMARVRAKVAAEAFSRFWNFYPHKVGKPDAARAFLKVASEIEPILEGLERYKIGKPSDRSWLNPSTFINQRRWEDVPATITPGAQNGRQGNSVSAAADALVGVFEGRASGGSREEGQTHVRMLPAR